MGILTGRQVARQQVRMTGTLCDSTGYDRTRDLPRLIGCWPTDSIIADPSCRGELVARLRQALRAERRRGIGRQWSYDLVRHRTLVVALRSELAGGEVQRGSRRAPHSGSARHSQP